MKAKPMSKEIKLPRIIKAFVKAKNDRDVNAVINCFASDAVVHDEGREMRGVTAIKEWSDEVNKKYKPHAEVTNVAEIGDKTIVTADVSGSFPGSPVQLRYNFTLKGDKIAALLIEG